MRRLLALLEARHRRAITRARARTYTAKHYPPMSAAVTTRRSPR